MHNVQFVGGCSGNTQGVSRLIEGMDVNFVDKDGNKIVTDKDGNQYRVDEQGNLIDSEGVFFTGTKYF